VKLTEKDRAKVEKIVVEFGLEGIDFTVAKDVKTVRRTYSIYVAGLDKILAIIAPPKVKPATTIGGRAY
jgi:hypothetical protein